MTSACDDGGGAKADKKAEQKAEEKVDAGEVEAPPAPEETKTEAGPELGAEGGTGEGGSDEGGTGEGGTGEGGTGEGGTGEGGTDAAAPAVEDEGDKKPKDDKKAKGGGDKAAAGPKIDGEPLYLKKCKSCHGVDGKGDTKIGRKVEISSLAKTKLSKAKIISTATKGVPDTKMKSYKKKLSKEEIEAISVYIKKKL